MSVVVTPRSDMRCESGRIVSKADDATTASLHFIPEKSDGDWNHVIAPRTPAAKLYEQVPDGALKCRRVLASAPADDNVRVAMPRWEATERRCSRRHHFEDLAIFRVVLPPNGKLRLITSSTHAQ